MERLDYLVNLLVERGLVLLSLFAPVVFLLMMAYVIIIFEQLLVVFFFGVALKGTVPTKKITK